MHRQERKWNNAIKIAIFKNRKVGEQDNYALV
jgi:hypothetical protein